MVDIEDMSDGVSIMDLGLNEFRLDLLEYMHTHKMLSSLLSVFMLWSHQTSMRNQE